MFGTLTSSFECFYWLLNCGTVVCPDVLFWGWVFVITVVWVPWAPLYVPFPCSVGYNDEYSGMVRSGACPNGVLLWTLDWVVCAYDMYFGGMV